MQRKLLGRSAALACGIVLGLGRRDARGATFCVDSASALRTALLTGTTNGQENTIQIVQGTYLTAGTPFTYGNSGSGSLALLGGYAAGCGSRVVNPTNTILDAQFVNVVLFISGATTANFQVQGFTIRNGRATGTTQGGGLHFNNIFAGATGNLTVDHNIFFSNGAESFGGGMNGGTQWGVTVVRDNLFIGNWAGHAYASAILTSNGTAHVLNNTFTGNTAPNTGGLRLYASPAGTITNNILYGNANGDLALSSTDIVVRNNIIGSIVRNLAPGPGSGSNLASDPVFVGGGNYRLRVNSPAINMGLNSAPGGLSATDLDGNPRASGSMVDIGAYEYGFGGPCVTDSTSLCLNDGRFRVNAFWKTANASGTAIPVPVANDTGAFWFFSPQNLEIMVKVVNGCDFNNTYWVFGTGLTNVEVTVVVIDTKTGTLKTYVNPLNTPYAPLQDTSAFPSCP